MKRYNKSVNGAGESVLVLPLVKFLYGWTIALGQSGNEPYFALENYSERARITYEDGTPVVPGVHAQLYIGSLGDPPDAFQPVSPGTITMSRQGFEGYIEPRFVYLPVGFFGGQFVSVQLRAFDGLSWESSTLRGESITLDLKLLDQVHGPNRLTGLEPFSISTVPEPETWCLLAVGGVVMGGLAWITRR